ncbi:MAG TPA: Mur ligase domain-containing protein, partial [Gammaproteobacteria bacterium]|nr:Mur ligase domain-containing protein [Gammaproteobacteria bacterium]
MRRIKRIHFIGIGGAGMGGIAEVLLTQGFEVSGSDLHESAMTQRLKKIGANVYEGHACEYVRGADVVVVSAAIPQNNPEIQEALAARIPIV